MQFPVLPSLWGFGLKLPGRKRGAKGAGELRGEKEVGREREGEENRTRARQKLQSFYNLVLEVNAIPSALCY